MSKHKEKKKNNPKPQLPHGWVVHVSKTYPDRVYYFNTLTACTTWEFPIAPSESTIERERKDKKTEEKQTAKKKRPVERVKREEKRYKTVKKGSKNNDVKNNKYRNEKYRNEKSRNEKKKIKKKVEVRKKKKKKGEDTKKLETLPVAESGEKSAAEVEEKHVASAEISSGPEDYVDEDDEPAEIAQKQRRNSPQEEEASTSSGFELKPCFTMKNNVFKTGVSKYKDSSSSSDLLQPAAPIIFSIKSLPDSKVKKVKPSVHFADPPSPTFSAAETETVVDDDPSTSPPNKHCKESTEPEYIADSFESMMPPSPPVNSIYQEILDSELLQDESTKFKKYGIQNTRVTAELLKTCKPFCVSEYKKALEAKNIALPHKNSSPSPAVIQTQENLIPPLSSSTIEPPTPANTTMRTEPPPMATTTSPTCFLGKRKLSIEEKERNQKKLALPATSEINDIMDSDFILWDSDNICDKNNVKTDMSKLNNSNAQAQTSELKQLPNVMVESPKTPLSKFSFSSSNNSPQDNVFSFTPNNVFQTPFVHQENKSPSFSFSKPGADSYIPESSLFDKNKAQESTFNIPRAIISENLNMKSSMDFEISKNISYHSKSNEKRSLGTSVQDATLPKKMKQRIGFPEQDATVSVKPNVQKVSSSCVSLDSVGMESTSSCNSSSHMPVAHSMWENLLRPIQVKNNPGGRSFADLWSSSQDTRPIEEEDMEWESENIDAAVKVNKENDFEKVYDDYSLHAWHIIVDTNIILYDVKYIEELRDTQFEDLGFPIIVIPWIVLQELDNLKAPKNKKNENLVNMGKAREAVSFILENLSTAHPRMKGQSYDEFSQCNYTSCSNNDDKILHFCSSLQKRGCRLTLLTEDKNLRVKAISSRVEACSKSELRRKHAPVIGNLATLSPEDQHNQVSMELTNTTLTDNVKADEIFCKVKAILLKVLKQFLVYGMKKFSESMWQRLVVRKPPWSLADVLFCFRHHWIAIFKFELPPNAQGLIEDLDKMLRHKKGYGRSLTEVAGAVEAALGLCTCLSHKKFEPQLVAQTISQLKKLLAACHGGEMEMPSSSSVSSLETLTAANILTTSSQVEFRGSGRQFEVPQKELLEVQNHFTALWERVHSFCAKLKVLMSSVDAMSSPGVDVEIEKNISAVLRTVKQFVQLNKKLLNNTNISPSCQEIQELYSILLSDSMCLDDESFSHEALCEFYSQRRVDLLQAQSSFEGFVSLINSGVRFLMSKSK